MHQEHNVPWNTLASNFYFRRDNPRYTPRRTGLFPRNLPTQCQSLNHFARTLSKTITTFSKTERPKYESSFNTRAYGLLFPDELRDRYPEVLNGQNQRIDYWIKRSKVHGQPYCFSSFRDEDLADVVKVLIIENQMEQLLKLAHHPQINLWSLSYCSQSYQSGFERVMDVTLLVYVLLNLFAAANMLEGGEYLETKEYQDMVYDLSNGLTDYTAQLPRAFLNPRSEEARKTLPELHHDLSELQGYLKINFGLLYRYDMLARECGQEIDWADEVTRLFGRAIALRVKLERIYVGDIETIHFA